MASDPPDRTCTWPPTHAPPSAGAQGRYSTQECLTIRDEVGQAARVLTGYDMLVPSILVEAQMGRASTEKAGPCPLRGMRTAAVIPAAHPGTRLAAGASLLDGAAGLEDKVADGDLPSWSGREVGRASGAARRAGERLARESTFDAEALSGAVREASEAESTGSTLDDFLRPAGRAGGVLFAHTAAIAGQPANEAPLRRAGEAFGRLVHLLDAVDDYHRDRKAGAFNPLAASGTPPAEAHRLARRLAGEVRESLDQAELQDPELARAILGPVLAESAERPFRVEAAAVTAPSGKKTAATGVAASVVMVLPALLAGIFGGRRRWGRRPPPGYDPYCPPGYGYRYRRGPSCCDLLACDCCANLACEDCCGGDVCCCCC